MTTRVKIGFFFLSVCVMGFLAAGALLLYSHFTYAIGLILVGFLAAGAGFAVKARIRKA